MDDPEYLQMNYQVEEEPGFIETIRLISGNQDILQRIESSLADIEEMNKKTDFKGSVQHKKESIRARTANEYEIYLSLITRTITSSSKKNIIINTLYQYITYLACASIAAEENQISLAWKSFSKAEHQLGYYLGLTSSFKNADSNRSTRSAETKSINKDTQRKLLLGYLLDLKPNKKSGWQSKQVAAETVAEKYLAEHTPPASSSKTPEESRVDLIAMLADLLASDKVFKKAFEA